YTASNHLYSSSSSVRSFSVSRDMLLIPSFSNKKLNLSLGDGVDTQSKVPDEQQQNISSADEGTGTIPEDDFEDDADINDDASDDNDESDDEKMKSSSDEILDPNKSNDEHDEEEEYDDEFNVEEGEKMDEEEDNEVTKELYKDVNVNLGNTDVDHSGADQKNASEYKLLNLDNPFPTTTMIASLMDTTIHHEITSTTIVPPLPPFFNPLQLEATPTPTLITFEATTSFTSLLDFASVFKFNERVTNLEKELSEIKQVDQDEAQTEKREYIELVDSTVRTMIKEEVNTQLHQILPQAISDIATLFI
nr:hypothetical protein [Tanacetum cinerariifolium]